jgi:hypothetical protein
MDVVRGGGSRVEKESWSELELVRDVHPKPSLHLKPMTSMVVIDFRIANVHLWKITPVLGTHP